MKKAIIIDDRTERKKLHLSDNSISQLEIMDEKGELTISDGWNSGIVPFEVLDDYDLIAIHRTYLTNNNIFNKIIDYIKNKNKWLVVFSGGITHNTILLHGHQLNINSTDFYTEKLPYFIKDFCKGRNLTNPLLYFLYGESWRLTLLLQYRYLLWEYGDIEELEGNASDFDIKKEDEIRNALWPENSYHTLEEVSIEIEIEKNKKKSK